MRKKLAVGLLLLAAGVSGQVQRGRVATDFWGRVVSFETAANLSGEIGTPVERILELSDGVVKVTAASELESWRGGVSAPRVNDYGDLRVYSFHVLGTTSAIGGTGPTRHIGVVRHTRDGWEVRYPGRAGLSRDGRWAVFSSRSPVQTVWVDLWTTGEFLFQGEALDVDSVADDGAVAAVGTNSLVIRRPGVTPSVYALEFQPQSAMIDRWSAFAVVNGADGLWQVDLASGVVRPWVRQCDKCEVLDVGWGGSVLVYSQWSILYVVSEADAAPRRLTAEGQLVEGAVLDGWNTKVIASTLDGIVSFDRETGAVEVLVPGETKLTRTPSVLAPGMWVRQEGRGLSAVEVSLNGTKVEPLGRSANHVTWVVPEGTPTGPVTMRTGQKSSPFEPATATVEVQVAAPTFILQKDAGVGTDFFSDWPVIHHAASGEPVTGLNPARPGETITVLMTGVNGSGAAVEWILSKLNVDEFFYPVFVSAEAHASQVGWSVVRLKMPAALPTGICALGALYGQAQNGVLLITDSSQAQ